ncbi:MAG TPA: protein kinase [Gemmatimonadales bacterium]|nr:protein kinase [Gemmatimonadales bacterium]
MSGPSPPADLLGFQAAIAGRYSIEREIGRGGMGIVYLARDVVLERPVAIKLLPPAQASHPETRARFLREARTAARLSHPNIVPIHAVEEAGEFVFIVMAYIQGETLRQRVEARGPLPVAVGSRILREVAWALGHAHAQGVVHRDVKPENILLEAGTDRALVTDFGIAQVRTARGEPTGTEIVGTPQFMSPEQASGEPVDHRSDLYSLGVVAFYAFSGAMPFEGDTPATILAKHISRPAPPLRTVAPGLPGTLTGLVDRLLAKSPADRVQQAVQVTDALGGVVERRHELPPAVRAFIADRKADDTRAAVIGLTAPLTLGIPAALLFTGEAVLTLAGFALIGGLISVPLSFIALSARRLLRAGYGRDDVLVGLQQDVDRREEELVHLFGKDHEADARRLRRWGAAGVGAAIAMLTLSGASGMPEAALVTGGLLSAVAGMVAWHRGDKRTDTSGKRRLKMWRGAIGRLLFRLAGIGVEARTGAPALTRRPTEVAIGMVVEGLFEALPKPTREALGDLPGVVHALEADAQRMRERIRELDALLAGAGVGDSHEDARHAMDLLREARQAATGRLAQTVAALETLRVDLLRLRAGTVTLDNITHNLGAARELSDQVERLLAGQDEVERLSRAASERAPRARA